MDPRLRARRIAVQRAAGRRRLRRLLVLVGLLAVVASALAVTYSPGLAVEELHVSGATHTPVAEVLEAAGIEVGDPLVWSDTGAARRRIEALPWVASAEVRKRWPHGVAIEVRERVPVAVVTGADGAGWLVDGTAQVLGPLAAPTGLVRLEGAPPVHRAGERVEPAWRAAVHVAAALPPSLAARTASVAMVEGRPVLRLAPSGEVRLHDTSQLEEKLLAALTVLDEVPVEEVAVLDVTVPDAPVVTRNPR